MKKQSREELLERIEQIQKLPREEMWRAVRDFTLEVNPVIRKEDEIFQREIALIREQQDNDEARSKGGHFRYALRIPTSIVNAIRQFDPEFMMPDKRKYKSKDATNKLVRKLMRIFPEYRIPRKI